jgi:topoisomerase-4 subunit A
VGRAPVRRAARRSEHRLSKIADRLELVGGYIIAFLNLDRVIEIIRTEDEPKPVMMAEFELTDRQAEAILNMRLRSLAQARGDGAQARTGEALEKEKAELETAALVRCAPAHPDEARLGKLLERYGPETLLGRAAP